MRAGRGHQQWGMLNQTLNDCSLRIGAKAGEPDGEYCNRSRMSQRLVDLLPTELFGPQEHEVPRRLRREYLLRSRDKARLKRK